MTDILSFNGTNLSEVRQKQSDFFMSNHTQGKLFRLKNLKKLKKILLAHEKKLLFSVKKDLGRCYFDTYMTEMSVLYKEIDYAIKNLETWMKPQGAPSLLSTFWCKNKIINVPLGKILIISPWNFPLLLLLAPLVGALAAGNCVVLKPSEQAPAVANTVAKMISSHFQEELIAVFLGDARVSKSLCSQRWDHLLFTGSSVVGKSIAQQAALTMTPTTFELGGKCPCIVTKKCDLKISVQRIVFGKIMNSGQICVAPDYIAVEDSIYEEFSKKLKERLKEQLKEQLTIIKKDHYQKLVQSLDKNKIIWKQEKSSYPFLVCKIDDWNHPIMKEEIFAPILPVVTYSDKKDLLTRINSLPAPLATYLFSKSKEDYQFFSSNIKSGSFVCNDTLVHLANPNLPFGGVAESGLGSYRGWYSFSRFSQTKVFTKASTAFDLPVRYYPHTATKEKFLRFINRLS